MTILKSWFAPRKTLWQDAAATDAEHIWKRLSVVLAAKYAIVRQLGAGGMATVWLAQHRIHGGLFAIKVLHPHLAAVTELREAFHREAVHTAVLAGHPNIVPVFDCDCAWGLCYLTMPYVQGCDLDEALQHCGRFPVEDALTIALEIAATLAYAEEHGILHGDLTSGNIRIDNFGQIWVLDFGLSRPVRIAAADGRFIPGTPSAMSPEQIRGEPVDIRSDLYALGVLLFQITTGCPPFSGNTLEEIEEQHLRGQVCVPAELSRMHPRLGDLLKCLMERDPDKRPPSAKAAEQALREMGATSRRLDCDVTREERRKPVRKRLSALDTVSMP